MLDSTNIAANKNKIREVINSLTKDNLFRISLSVGTKCNASCPYCGIGQFEQTIATGNDLIKASLWFIKTFKHYSKHFYLRVTGGEIGLVPNLEVFLDFVNNAQEIEYIQIFSNGDIFKEEYKKHLAKCNISEHVIHDVINNRFVRYDKFIPPQNIDELLFLRKSREKLCKEYYCVMVDTESISRELKEKLKDNNVHFFDEMTRLGIHESKFPPLKSEYEECYYSKKLYVFDVSTLTFMHCCEEKNPQLGKKYDSPLEFFIDNSSQPYEQCKICRRPNTNKPKG